MDKYSSKVGLETHTCDYLPPLETNAMASSEKHMKRVTKALGDKVLKVQRLAPTVKGKDKTDQVATRTLPQLPIEVWENMINHLWDDQWTLKYCKLVCRAWYARSRFHLHGWITVGSVKDVKECAKKLKQTPKVAKRPHSMTIRADDLSALSTAAILLARKLPRLERLSIQGSEWQPWTMHKDIFLHLSGFSVTRLNLDRVVFPSITVFGRLVCALSRLLELECEELSFTWHDHYLRDTFGLYHNRVKVRSLLLVDIPLESEKLINFFACISSRLQRLIIYAPAPVAQSQYKWRGQQLLDAASCSLSEMQLNLTNLRQCTDTVLSAADPVLSFTHNTSLQSLRLIDIDISQEFDLNPLCQVLLSIKSDQLREIVIVLDWFAQATGIDEMREEVKNLLKNCEPARHRETDNYLSSDLFTMLSKVEFALTPYNRKLEDPSAAFTVAEEQWKQQLAPLFPQLTKRGVFRATLRDYRCKDKF